METTWICNQCAPKMEPCKLVCPGVDPPIFCPMSCPSDGKECNWRREDEDKRNEAKALQTR